MKWRKKEFWELLAARRFSPWGLVHTETSFKVSAIYFIFFCYYMNAASSRTDVLRASFCPRVITSLNSTPAFRLFPHAHLCRDDVIAPPTPQQQRRWLHRCVYLFLPPPSSSFLLPLFARVLRASSASSSLLFSRVFLAALERRSQAWNAPLHCQWFRERKTNIAVCFPLVVDKAWDHLYCAVHTVGWC